MQSEKDKWIEEVMASADRLNRISAAVADRVMAAAIRPQITQGKEQWITDVIDSTHGMKPASAPDMTDRVLERIATSKQYGIPAAGSASLIWRIAASVVLIALLNTVTIYELGNSRSKLKQQTQMEDVAAEFGIGHHDGTDAGAVFFGN